MDLNLKDITFIVVTYKSHYVIHNCLKSLPKECKKIIIENSNNSNLQKELNAKYDNIEVVLSENIGMGRANNLGLKKTKTQFAYILNPDTKLKNDTIDIILKEVKGIKDFTLLSPINSDSNYPNYKKKSNNNIGQNIISVEVIDGFSMLLNLKKFPDKVFFDENFFLYLENDDLCKQIINKKEKIYILKNSIIEHMGSNSSDINIEYFRHWHWMWSKFYFNKKHYGFFIAINKTFFNLVSAISKYFIYTLIFNNHKKKIYKMRTLGLISSMLGKDSYLRPEN